MRSSYGTLLEKELSGAPIMTWADEMSYLLGGKLALAVTSDRRRTSANYAQVYLPGSRNQVHTQADQEATSKAYMKVFRPSWSD